MTYSIQPGSGENVPLVRDSDAKNDHIEIVPEQQPAGPVLAQQGPQKKPVNALGLAGHILGVAGHIVALPFYAVMAPGFLLGSLMANAISNADEKNAPPLYACMLGDVIEAFHPLTNQITGIYAASQGKTLEEYKKEAKNEAKRNERLMQSMQTKLNIEDGLEKAIELETQNPPAIDNTTINTKDQFGLTHLMKAKTAAEVTDRLQIGADVNVKDEQGLTALVRFAYAGKDELVGALLADKKISGYDCFAAQTALKNILEYEKDPDARQKYEDIIKVLLAYKPPSVAAPPPRQNLDQQAPREPNVVPQQENQEQTAQQPPLNPPPPNRQSELNQTPPL